MSSKLPFAPINPMESPVTAFAQDFQVRGVIRTTESQRTPVIYCQVLLCMAFHALGVQSLENGSQSWPSSRHHLSAPELLLTFFFVFALGFGRKHRKLAFLDKDRLHVL